MSAERRRESIDDLDALLAALPREIVDAVHALPEKEFTEKTRVFGAEIFRDDNVGVTISVNETGTLSAVPTK